MLWLSRCWFFGLNFRFFLGLGYIVGGWGILCCFWRSWFILGTILCSCFRRRLCVVFSWRIFGRSILAFFYCFSRISLGFGVFSCLLGNLLLLRFYSTVSEFRVTFWKILVCENVSISAVVGSEVRSTIVSTVVIFLRFAVVCCGFWSLFCLLWLWLCAFCTLCRRLFSGLCCRSFALCVRRRLIACRRVSVFALFFGIFTRGVGGFSGLGWWCVL